jgi:hypothetical protein
MRGVQLIVGAVTLGLVAGYAWSAMPVTSQRGAPAAPALAMAKPTPEEMEHSAYYSHCADAWAAGRAPIFRGQPGYRKALDEDSDGIACEPDRGR